MAEIKTTYDLEGRGSGRDVVSRIVFDNDVGCQCVATINPEGEDYTFTSFLLDDKKPVVAPKAMSLADCILNATMLLGLIPPYNFDPIPSPNSH